MKAWCNTEDYTGGEGHYAHRSSFDWIMVGGVAMWACDNCRHELEDQGAI